MEDPPRLLGCAREQKLGTKASQAGGTSTRSTPGLVVIPPPNAQRVGTVPLPVAGRHRVARGSYDHDWLPSPVEGPGEPNRGFNGSLPGDRGETYSAANFRGNLSRRHQPTRPPISHSTYCFTEPGSSPPLSSAETTCDGGAGYPDGYRSPYDCFSSPRPCLERVAAAFSTPSDHETCLWPQSRGRARAVPPPTPSPWRSRTPRPACSRNSTPGRRRSTGV